VPTDVEYFRLTEPSRMAIATLGSPVVPRHNVASPEIDEFEGIEEVILAEAESGRPISES
jgi:hypothetical protein